jgi:Fe-S oxidoreductase
MGRRKAEQIRATGAKYVVSPCANCKKQLKEVCEDNGLDDVEVVGLHDLLLNVIDFGVPEPEQQREGVSAPTEGG